MITDMFLNQLYGEAITILYDMFLNVPHNSPLPSPPVFLPCHISFNFYFLSLHLSGGIVASAFDSKKQEV